ncbi:MAG: dipeptidase [Ancalomicrobiaceae bacterium]|nr:dipeptidase [Ancalomicrobiaceae bacterium]
MPASDAALTHARALIAQIPLFDAHNDMPWEIRARHGSDVAAARLTEDRPGRDTDIAKLLAGGVAAQFWAAFIPTDVPHPLRTALEQIELIHRFTEAHADVFLPARSPDDVARAKAEGRIASFIAVEGGVALEESLEILSIFHRLGVRYMTLCHNETLAWIDSTTDVSRHGGLTEFGRRVIAEMNRLGLMVDLSHTSHDAMRAVLDISEAPVVFTHCNAYGLCRHPRNVPDDVLARIPANGGIVMATFVPDFISQRALDWARPLRDDFGKARHGLEFRSAVAAVAAEKGPKPAVTIPELADHIDYMTARVGIDHIGIGSDFYGGPTLEGLEDVSRFAYLIAELVHRGWSDDALAKLMSGNFVRVFRQVESVAGRLKGLRKPAVGRL